MITVISVITLIAIVAIACFLAFWSEYKDGIFGHIALAMIAGSAVLMLIGIWQGLDFYYHPLVVGMFIGMALFLLRHAVNAIRFRRRQE